MEQLHKEKSIKDIPDYNIMWMMVLFDLPTDSPKEKKIASDFRNFLKDNGFEMAQYSVYMRFTGTKEQSQKYIRIIKEHAPKEGDICILFITDKQFSQIIHLENSEQTKLSQKPEQLILF